jgi:hypothetical protein
MPATNFPGRAPGDRKDPAIGAIAISYGGGDQIVTVAARAIYVSTAGNLAVDMVNGDTVTFTGLLVGMVYPIAVSKIYQAGSTAAGLILY